MLKDAANFIGKFVKTVLFVIAGAAVLLAIFYSAYLLIFLLIIGVLMCIGLVFANWDDVVKWADED